MDRMRFMLLIFGPVFLGSGIVASTRRAAGQEPSCENEVFMGEDHCFALGSDPLSFQDARLYCVENFVGGELASLSREGDKQKVVSYFTFHFSDMGDAVAPSDDLIRFGLFASSKPDVTRGEVPKKEGNPSDDVKPSTTETGLLDQEAKETVSVAMSTTQTPQIQNQTSSESNASNESAILKKREIPMTGDVSPTNASETTSTTALDQKQDVTSANEPSPSPLSDLPTTTTGTLGPQTTINPMLHVRLQLAQTEWRQVQNVLDTGVWLGAYRNEQDSSMFSWFRLGGYLLLKADVGTDCVAMDPSDKFQVKAVNCTQLRLPLCQLLSCPRRHCLNGGRCRHGFCQCPEGSAGELCHILPRDVQNPQVIPVGARTIPGIDEGHRNLFIALLVAVGVASLFIVLVLSKDRINQFLTQQRRSNTETEEDPTVEVVALGTATLNEAAVEIEDIDVSAGLTSASTEPLAGKATPTASKAESVVLNTFPLPTFAREDD